MSQILKTAMNIIRNKAGNKTTLFSAYRAQSGNVDVSGASATGAGKPRDVLMQTLRTAPSPAELLGATSRHLQVMNHKHLLQVLRSLFHLNKEFGSDYDIRDVTKNPTFGSLCQALKRSARALETNEYIEVLKILSYLQVPINSLIQQTMLQLVRTNINYLNIRQIMFVDFLLTKYDDASPLVDALRLALPLVFQIHLPLELDHEDLPLLKEMLYYSCTRNLPDRCINNIVTGLLLHDQAIDFQAAKNILFALTEVNVTAEIYPTRVKLLHTCFDVVMNSIHSMTFEEVLKLTAKLKSRILERHLEYYHPGLMDAIADYVVRSSVNLDKALLVARIHCKIAHTNLPLVEHLSKLAYEDPSALSRARPNLLFAFVNCLSNADYTPPQSQWDVIRQHISQNRVVEMSNIALPWTKFCLELASLGHYDEKLLSKLFSERVLSTYLSREDSTLDYIQLLLLHEATQTLGPRGAPAPPPDVLRRARELYPVHVRNHDLELALAQGLGGPEYFASNVQMPGGIVADHVIALQGAGSPIEVQGESEGKISLEKLNLPESALVVCVMKFNRGCYSLNSERLRGSFRLVTEVLEAQGRPTIALDLHSWLRLPAAERAPFLMREIRYKCQEAGATFSVL